MNLMRSSEQWRKTLTKHATVFVLVWCQWRKEIAFVLLLVKAE